MLRPTPRPPPPPLIATLLVLFARKHVDTQNKKKCVKGHWQQKISTLYIKVFDLNIEYSSLRRLQDKFMLTCSTTSTVVLITSTNLGLQRIMVKCTCRHVKCTCLMKRA